MDTEVRVVGSRAGGAANTGQQVVLLRKAMVPPADFSLDGAKNH
ncbi:MAG: hypothetical protein ACE5IY_03185 [bacterium]